MRSLLLASFLVLPAFTWAQQIDGENVGFLYAATENMPEVFTGGIPICAEEALWKRGASNAGYHYLGSAKTFALMGKAFAEALIGAQQLQR